MLNQSFLRSEIVERVALNTCPFSTDKSVHAGISCDWLLSLLSGLDAAGEDISEVCGVLKASSEYEKLDDVRYELSRVPVWYRLCMYSVRSANKISNRDAYGGRSVEEKVYEVGSSEFPKEVLPFGVGTASYKRGDIVQCSYPTDLAKRLGLDIVQHWEVLDSVVDWIYDFSRTEGLRSSPRLSIEQLDDDVRYNMSWCGTALSCVDKDSSGDKILAYIVKNAPVSTADVLFEGFASRRQTFNLLRALERADKIEKVQHGVYIAL